MGHSHHAHHDHSGPDHAQGPAIGALRMAFLINAAFTVIEAAGGWWTNSMAVWSDALHDLGDCLVLGLAWYLQRLSARGRDADYSYGYGRYSMLGGWVSAWILIAGAVMMVVSAAPRLLSPVQPNTGGMMIIALFGLAMNGFAAWKLHAGHSLNERGAYLHLLEDVLGWAAVLVGAVVIRYTGWSAIDPLLSIGISLFIVVNALRTLRKGTGILMQRGPERVDAAAIRNALLALHQVADVHDQHAWSLDGDYTVLTVHLVVNTRDLDAISTVKKEARQALHTLGVQHATIETELPDELCELLHH
ncbi:MAG: cation transporter [Flavobacteriales bacterium]|nr:cation transporter [Flavobacteriales bacterium]MBL0035216.1 cation transporter [Flavobacteriales bacterium]